MILILICVWLDSLGHTHETRPGTTKFNYISHLKIKRGDYVYSIHDLAHIMEYNCAIAPEIPSQVGAYAL